MVFPTRFLDPLVVPTACLATGKLHSPVRLDLVFLLCGDSRTVVRPWGCPMSGLFRLIQYLDFSFPRVWQKEVIQRLSAALQRRSSKSSPAAIRTFLSE
jgi:hypothetical protein